MFDSLNIRAQRRHIRLRLDGGFGTDENIDYALWRGYHQMLILLNQFSPISLEEIQVLKRR